MARLHSRLKADNITRIIAMPTMTDPESLAGMSVPIDPGRIRGLDAIFTAADIAMTTALTGLALFGRSKCAASDLARICGLTESDLPVALARACGRKRDGSPKFFNARIGRGGTVEFSVIQQRSIMRPDRYVRLDVEGLAAAPTAEHARFYAFAAEATIGNELVGGNVVSAPGKYFKLDRADDPDARLAAMVAWVQPFFGSAIVGHAISAGIHRGAVYVQAINSCNWSYDHRAAPRPWTDDKYWERTRLRERDGEWDGHALSIDAVRAAKVCEWLMRDGDVRIGPMFIREHWLFELSQALKQREGDKKGQRLLDGIRQHGATRAFELWVVANARSLGSPNVHQRETGEEGVKLRRLALADPGSPMLKPHATDPKTGESLTYAEYQWRVVDRFKRLFESKGISKWEYKGVIQKLAEEYRVGGREPKAPPPREPCKMVVAWDQLNEMAKWIYSRQFDNAAFEFTFSMVQNAKTMSGGYTGIDELIQDAQAKIMADDRMFSKLHFDWAGAQRAKGVQENLGRVGFLAAAKEFFLEALAATAMEPEDAA